MKINELEKKLIETNESEAKISLLIELSSRYSKNFSDKALNCLDKALCISQEIQNVHLEAKVLQHTGNLNKDLSDYKNAMENYFGAIEKFKLFDDQKSISECHNNIGLCCYNLCRYQDAIHYHEKALQVREKINDEEGIAGTCNNIGIVNFALCKYNDALENYKKSLELMKKLKNTNGTARLMNNIGRIYQDLSNYETALEFYLQSLKLMEKIGNKKGIASLLNNIGNIYQTLNYFSKALDYYYKSLDLKKEIGNKFGTAATLNNIGLIYQKIKDYPKALDYNTKSLHIKKELQDQKGIASSFNNIGEIYFSMKQYDNSLFYCQESLRIKEKIGDQRGIAKSLLDIAEIFIEINHFDEAFCNLKKGIKIAEKNLMKEHLLEFYELYMRIYSKTKDFEKAFHYSKLYSELKNTIYTEESSKKIAELQTRYETEKKEKEAEIYRLKNFELEEKVKERTEELREANLQLQIEIEEHKKDQIQIKKDLEEKKILLQELYHRTKNNMQLISSLLRMQSESSNDEFVHATFETINNRIKAMSLVQQKLYQTKELSVIDLRDYIEDVVNMLRRCFSSQSESISLRLELKKVFVIVDSAVPLGLVLNELITNCYKHAFPDNRKGEISIQLFETKDEMITIQIEDNGIGFSKDYNPKVADSIGFQTIYSLVEYQLKGTINYKSENGLYWEIKFKNDNQNIRI